MQMHLRERVEFLLMVVLSSSRMLMMVVSLTLSPVSVLSLSFSSGSIFLPPEDISTA